MTEFFAGLINNIGGAHIAGTIITSIIAFAAVGAFIFNGITNRKLEGSNRLTAEKERVDRALEFIERFDEKRYMKLLSKKFREYPKTLTELKSRDKLEGGENFLSTFSEAQDEIHYFLFFFDTVAILYNKNKIDRDIFESKLQDYFLSFYLNFDEEIFRIIEGIKSSDKTFYYYDYYLKLIEELLEFKIKANPDKKESLARELETCRQMLKKND
jgi:hypothetical protein